MVFRHRSWQGGREAAICLLSMVLSAALRAQDGQGVEATVSAGDAQGEGAYSSAPVAGTAPADGTVVPEGGAEPESPPTLLQQLQDSLFDGDFVLEFKFRAEIVEQEDTDTAQAYTERTRVGYGTKPFHGFSLYFDIEDIRSADDSLYNAAGLNGEPDKAVVADPEDTELNQFLARYENEYFGAIAGRQRMILDDHRFVGNVVWRQNEQTLDAYTLTSQWIPDVDLLYSYVDDVNRIFGPDAGRDFRSDSHLVNASFTGLPFGKLTGFAYLLDFGNGNTNSSDSYGVRFAGSTDLTSDLTLGYLASYAYQVEGDHNPTDYDADFYVLEATLGWKGVGKIGAGYEVLGSDDGDFAFQTPLATLHKFNGWADLFLTTPNNGLQDLYFLAGADLPLGIKSLAVYHMFYSEDDNQELGGEFNGLLTKKLTENISLLGKLAVFHSESPLPKTQKYWLQVEAKF